MLAFAVGYIVVTVSSHQRVVQAQKARLEEVVRSEEKYRGLFDNALAGIMKFSPETLTIYDSNEAIRSIYICGSQDELQRCISTCPLSRSTAFGMNCSSMDS